MKYNVTVLNSGVHQSLNTVLNKNVHENDAVNKCGRSDKKLFLETKKGRNLWPKAEESKMSETRTK